MAAYGALKSSALNVYINAGSIKDTIYIDAQLAELEHVTQGIEQVVDGIYQMVKARL